MELKVSGMIGSSEIPILRLKFDSMSKETASRYTITAALPYTNGPIHIGHLAGVYVPADIYARYLRLQRKDVAFICGSDEHGFAIPMKAKKEGVSPRILLTSTME